MALITGGVIPPMAINRLIANRTAEAIRNGADAEDYFAAFCARNISQGFGGGTDPADIATIQDYAASRLKRAA